MKMSRILAVLSLALVLGLSIGCENKADSTPSQDAKPVGKSVRGLDTPPPIQKVN